MEIFLQSASTSLLVGVVFLIVAVVYEWRTYQVPNILTFSAMATAFIYCGIATWFAPDRSGGFAGVIAGLAIGGAVLAFCYASGFLGGGCVKAQAAFGAWVGSDLPLSATCQVMLVSSAIAAGGIFAYGLWRTKRKSEYAIGEPLSSATSHGPLHGQLPISLATLLGVALSYSLF